MIKNNKEKNIEDFSEASKVPLERIFKTPDNFSAEWCFKKRAPQEGRTYDDKDDEFC